ncbi:hypothetical protein Q5530_13015 [Saccharothrix sp. BKS2]|uniref:hypothetical protein n=1 Tax=Saccharothrix sp. BKS2 TaxID=3064400 RepID=UPI0039E83525
MSKRDTLLHAMHDIGLAAWFGGSLAGAVAVDGAADIPDPAMRLEAANDPWARWTPVSALAIGTHLVGGAVLLRANRDLVAGQRWVALQAAAKLVLTGAALAVTGYSGALGRRLHAVDGTAVEGGTTAVTPTSSEVARIQRQLGACRWLIPTLTGAVSVLAALDAERQRPVRRLSGMFGKQVRWLRAGR